MTDIVDRLRDRRLVAYRTLREAAADEIERLRRETYRQSVNMEYWMEAAVKRGHALVNGSTSDSASAEHAHDWFRMSGWPVGRSRCYQCGVWSDAETVSEVK